MLITRDDIQRVGDEETLLHFLEEKLNLPIPEKAMLAQIALPLPLPFLGLDASISEHIIDCQDFRGFSQDTLGERRPFLIRFRRESDFSEMLRNVAKGLSQQDINPDKIFFICADEHFKPFALAYFGDSDTEDWYAEVLNIFTWTQGNTRINTGFEHDLSALFSATESSTEFDDNIEIRSTSSSYKGKPDASKDLLIKLQNIGTPLGRQKDYNIHTGINLGYKNAFVIDEFTCKQLLSKNSNSADTELIEPFFDIPRKWRWELSNVLYIPSSRNKRWPWTGIRDTSEAERIFREAYPAISTYMDDYKDNLRKETNPVVFYWEFPSRKILRELESPKIIYRTNAISMQGAYDKSYRFLTSATHFIPTEDLSLLAILNSKIFGWYAQGKWKSSNPKVKALSFSKENMKKAPIADRTEEQKAELSNLVQQILDDPDSPKVPDIEREIDQLVYELYELTPAEIALIKKGIKP